MSGNVATTNTPTEVDPYKASIFNDYITFCALGGLITTDEGKLTTLTQQDFCAAHGINPRTAQRWKKETPNFAELVRQRRDEIVPLARETAAWNKLYLIGMGSKDHKAAVEALKLVLGHYSQLQLPTQRQEVKVELNSWTGLMEAKRNVIEGEVVDGAPAAD